MLEAAWGEGVKFAWKILVWPLMNFPSGSTQLLKVGKFKCTSFKRIAM